MYCYLYEVPRYLIFSDWVPALTYYTHLPVIAIALIIAFVVYRQDHQALINRLLVAITLLFALWSTVDFVVWVSVSSTTIMFLWSLYGFLYAALALVTIYFAYVFFERRDMPFHAKQILFAAFVPVALATPTVLNLRGFDIERCGSPGYEGMLFVAYYTLLGGIAMALVLVFALRRLHKVVERPERQQNVLVALGLELFLATFFFLGYLTSYLNELGWLTDYSLEQYGAFAILALMALLAYIIVAYHAFNIHILAVDALVVTLIVLIGAEFAFVRSATNQILVLLTLFFTVVAGVYLRKSVRQEIAMRHNTERLARYLANANARLRELDKQKTEFVGIASHQLRSPITALTWQASLILEGSHGEVPEYLKPQIARIFESSQHLAKIVEDFLNVSRIEQGRMSFTMERHDIVEIVRGAVLELQPIAQQKGLTLSYEDRVGSALCVKADVGKLKQIFSNLLDNAIKYTPQGEVHVALHVEMESRKVYIDITDSGIGIAPEDLERLFHKFNRGQNANSTNVHGTGLGLYVAKEIMRAHDGWIHVASPGIGKGSTFTVELPLAPETSPQAEGVN